MLPLFVVLVTISYLASTWVSLVRGRSRVRAAFELLEEQLLRRGVMIPQAMELRQRQVAMLSAVEEEFRTSENRVSLACQAYCDAVLAYNDQLLKFPGRLLARVGRFHEAELYFLELPQHREQPNLLP
jgi:hypothetical protein